LARGTACPRKSSRRASEERT